MRKPEGGLCEQKQGLLSPAHGVDVKGMDMKRLVLLASCLLAVSCAAEMVRVNQMKMAPAREPDCKLELVEADMMELSPMGTKWDFLGTVSIGANDRVDPMSEATRAMIRPKACKMGGTAVALMQSSAATTNLSPGTSSGVTFAVLRPKQAPDAPTEF